MKAIKWTERKFLGYDKGYSPFFIERLKSAVPRLEELVSNCDEAKASERINESWSVKEHIGHLADIEQLHEGRLDDYLNGLDTLRPADMTNRETEDANHNGNTIPRLLADFRVARARYLQRLAAMDETILTGKHCTHGLSR